MVCNEFGPPGDYVQHRNWARARPHVLAGPRGDQHENPSGLD